MSPEEREYHVYRICTGCSQWKIEGGLVVFEAPSNLIKMQAASCALEAQKESRIDGVYNREEISSIMKEHNVWTEEDENKLQGYEKDLEELKTKFYQMYTSFSEHDRYISRKKIQECKEIIEELRNRKHEYDYVTDYGYALFAKTRFIITHCCTFNSLPISEEQSYLIDQIIHKINEERLSDSDYRDLARNEPWSSIYVAGKNSLDIFGVPACKMTDEQRYLLGWSITFDNIRQHPDAPPDSVLDDDDLLDGWMIIQRRKREKENNERLYASRLRNEKIAKAPEVFIPVSRKDEISKINDLNDAGAKQTIARRNQFLKAKGFAHDIELPDQRQRLVTEFNAKQSAALKGKK